MNTLQIESVNYLSYSNGILNLTVLGGLRIDALDRMRVTLKIELLESPRPALRHNLDLYNDTQTEKLIRKTAERLEIGTSVISASLSELTDQLESYRLEQLKNQQPLEDKTLHLNELEKQEAENYLKAPDLMERTMQDLAQTGIIGEATNSMILYVAMSSRKCAEPLSVISLAKSGMGKSYLQEKVALCIPLEDLLENTQFTENSFYYFKREEIRGKIFLIEDLDGAQSVLYPIRELQSKKRISKTVTVKDKTGHLTTVSLVVEGPVSVIGSTTKESIYEDNANRSILLYLDDSKEQDLQIQTYQQRLSAGLIDKLAEKQAQTKLQHVQKILEPVKIINPYALLISLPKEVFKPRRTMGLLLSFIETITYYHQKQREVSVNKETGEICIQTAPEDIEWAFRLLKETLFRKSDELNEACRSFYDYLLTFLKTNKLDKFYASDIRKSSRINPRTLQRYLQELTLYNYLLIVGGNKHKTGYQYIVNATPPQENIIQSIDKQLNEILENIKHQSNIPIIEPSTNRKGTPVRKSTPKTNLSHSTI